MLLNISFYEKFVFFNTINKNLADRKKCLIKEKPVKGPEILNNSNLKNTILKSEDSPGILRMDMVARMVMQTVFLGSNTK